MIMMTTTISKQAAIVDTTATTVLSSSNFTGNGAAGFGDVSESKCSVCKYVR
jgi:hypothetical protein